jgi:hypothetical protein
VRFAARDRWSNGAGRCVLPVHVGPELRCGWVVLYIMASKLLMDPKRAHHYKVEIEFADRLRNSSRAERKHLYSLPI